MQIVVTDGYALNPGDLSWESIASQGDLIIHERTRSDETAHRCRDATIVLTNKVPFDEGIFEKLPNLRLISVLATGYNVIDTVAARKRNIKVSNVPGYGTASVAQHTISLLLELTNAVGLHTASVNRGEWSSNPDWCYTLRPVMELEKKTLGIVGMGRIGQRVAAIAYALGMNIIYYNPSPKKDLPYRSVDLESVFMEADVVSLHCPAAPGNLGFVNRRLLEKMKSSAYLINTSRGQLIQEEDLAEILSKRVIAGVALDVLSKEPPPADHPLLNLENCLVTPHMAWMSQEARQRILDITAANIRAFLAGKPINVVNL